MENAQIAEMLDQIADLLELKQDDQFRIRSYRNAARTVRGMSRPVADLAAAGTALDSLPYIGKGIAEKIAEMLASGTCKRIEELRHEVPQGLPDLMRVPGLGPRKALELHSELGIHSLDELRKACLEHRVRVLRGLGEKTEQKILDGLEMLQAATGRVLYREASDYVRSLGRCLDGISAIERWSVAGSFRRCSETVGDLDVVIQPRDREEAIREIVRFGEIRKVDSRGSEKVTVHLQGGLQVDFRFFDRGSYGSALMYFTGSKAHNIAVRRRAQQRGWKLNEYGLFDGETLLEGAEEEPIYKRLGMAWTPPELREDRGEVEAAERGALPALLETGDVRGDFQSHTTATDGRNSIQQMAQAAAERGYKYFAITDHSKRVTMAHGLDDEHCRRHAEEIRKAAGAIRGMWLMAGIEVDILKNGKLDLEDKTLAALDWVVASIHYDRNQTRQEMTDRILAAVRSGVVHALGHPLGRIISKRDPLNFDLDKVFAACAEHNVFVEINGQPDRLDLPDIHLRQAREAGVLFTLATDAHKIAELDFMPLAVNVARRGWLSKADVLNVCTLPQLRRKINRR